MATATVLENQMFELLANCDKLFFVGTLADSRCRWSPKAAQQFPLTPEEAAGQAPTPWNRLVHEEDLPIFRQALGELTAGLRQNLHGEYRLWTREEDWIWTQVHLWALPSEGGPLSFAGTAENLMVQDTFDPITRLPSNYDFRAALEEIAHQSEDFGILILGLDAFKRVIDLHSYTFGDDVLRTFARKLQLHLPEGARLYRLDGDGFGILWPGKTREDMATLYDSLTQIARQPLRVQNTEVNLTFSGAACQYPADSHSGDGLFRCVRMALSTAKQAGGNQFVPYTQEISRLARRELFLMEKLRESVHQDFSGFYLNYQPLVLAEAEELYGCEVLLRWENVAFPEGVTPYEFIPALERIGLMPKVGGWVLQQAVNQCARWTALMPNFQMSINVTSAQFEDPEFRFFVMDCLTRAKLSPALITLELTESNSISNTEAVGHAFDFFRSQGIKIAFDDFGMGYASLDIFRVLSADELKIDRSFLERLSYDVTDQKIITHLINLCHSMNISVCVEGVETPEVVRILQQLGPKLFQGYYYNRPMSAQAFESFYLQKKESKVPIPTLFSAPQKSLLGEAPLRPLQPLGMDELVEGVNAGIFQVSIDEHFTFLSCNEGYRRMLGYTARQIEELFENRALAFVHPDDVEQLTWDIQHQLGMGDNIYSEFRIIRSDGTPLWVVGTGNVVKSRDGTPTLVVVIVDRSAQKRQSLQTETDLRKYRKILESIPGGVKCVRHDEYFTLEYISPAFLSLLGYNEQDIREQFADRYINMVLPEDVPKVLEDITTQLAGGANVITLRYRSPCKDGRILWLETLTRLCPPDPDGIQRYYSSVVDITDTVAPPHGGSRAHSLAQHHRACECRQEEICYTYDCRRDSITFSENFYHIYGRKPHLTFAEEIAQVHQEDQLKLGACLERLLAGEACPPVRVRLLTEGNETIWISIHFDTPQPEPGGEIATVTGHISLLDEDVPQEEPDYIPQCDPLTGLLNRRAVEETIRAQLVAQCESSYALYLIDVNNFKQINYQHGHPFGNQVLRELAQRLQNHLGPGAILGRIGGDEFIAFLPLAPDESPKTLGEALLQKICGGYAYEGILAKIAACVGVSCAPQDGNQFHELHRRAQAALYRAKARGGCQCATFSHAGEDCQPL